MNSRKCSTVLHFKTFRTVGWLLRCGKDKIKVSARQDIVRKSTETRRRTEAEDGRAMLHGLQTVKKNAAKFTLQLAANEPFPCRIHHYPLRDTTRSKLSSVSTTPSSI
jgi:hypothetical protein